jgi:hypothetical protein
VTAALPPPVGWKLSPVATPIAGGTSMPSTRMTSALGTPTWYTPPLTLPLRPSAAAIGAVSSGKGVVGGAPSALAGGVPVSARAAWTARAIVVGSPRASMCMYTTRGDSQSR